MQFSSNSSRPQRLDSQLPAQNRANEEGKAFVQSQPLQVQKLLAAQMARFFKGETELSDLPIFPVLSDNASPALSAEPELR